MFKQLFISIVIIIIIITISYILIKRYFLHSLQLHSNVIKYLMEPLDKYFLDKYSTRQKLTGSFSGRLLFYTNDRWSSRNNNYLIKSDRYYIIEPGYYYYLTDDYKITGEIDIYAFDFGKWNNKILVNH
jgi:hypothetical protein